VFGPAIFRPIDDRRTVLTIVRRVWPCAILAAAVGVPAPALAQEGEIADASASGLAAEPEPFRFDVLAGVWLPRLGGTIELGSGSSLDVEDDLDLDNSETLPLLELTVRGKGPGAIRGSGFIFSTHESGAFTGRGRWGSLTFADGDPYRASTKFDSFAIEFLWQVAHPYVRDAGGAGDDVDMRISVVYGARYVGVTQSVTKSGVARERVDGDWIGFMIGGELDLDWEPPEGTLWIGRALRLNVGGSIGIAGGGDGGSMWSVRAGLTMDLTPNFGLMFGYRLLEMDVENGDDFTFDAGLQGLFLTTSIRF